MQNPAPRRRFVVDDPEPAYAALIADGRLDSRVQAAWRAIDPCCTCPRACHARRLSGETGTCRTGREALVASAFPHSGEERVLSGWRGSGTIFFGQCNLRCVFCQNSDISDRVSGELMTPAEIAELMLRLQVAGCHNVNLVTPSHVVPHLLEAVALAGAAGLRLPIVYNTSAYDSVATLRLLDGVVDVYMPDFKFWNPATALRLAAAEDYPDRAREAILEMHRQVGVLHVGADGLVSRGVLIRHLVMPGQTAESAAIFEWLAREVSPDTFVNIMGQYHPAHRVGEPQAEGGASFAEIGRRPTRTELHEAYEAARRAGLGRFADQAPQSGF
jgi:putative pyruvate formate lyase activating enzyme